MAQAPIIRVAAAQIAPDLESGAGTLERVLAATADAASRGAKLIVFPETFLPWYPYFSFVRPPAQTGVEHVRLYENAVTAPGHETEALSAAARKHAMVIAIGVNERDHGSLYNAQLIFDANGDLVLKRRKITPTYHERMIWGQGDGSGLKVVETAVGRVGALACWEHYNPLARYALMAQHEEIHVAQFPGSLVGPIFGEQIEVTIRHHALESGCFVVNATGWLTEDQTRKIAPDEALRKALTGGCMTAIISPEGRHLAPPLTQGEGLLVADLDMGLIVKRKRMMDFVGHYARPELLSLNLDNRAAAPLHATAQHNTGNRKNVADDGTGAPALTSECLINELQSFGARLADPGIAAPGRRGGAGPSDHKAMTVDGMTVMIPVYTAAAFESPYLVERPNSSGRAQVSRDGFAVGEVSFPATPNFYRLKTAEGVPYSQIATLHGRDVLATTVLQSCVRYQSRTRTCQFCAIGQSLAAGRTIERKTPAQLAEVARAAVDLDGVTHMVMTTGTPASADRGAAILADSAEGVKSVVDLPIQVQCEPPDDDAWFSRLRDAGADSLGMHLEAVTESVRRRIMPGKAQVPVERYFEAFAAAVPVFGRGQVSTYILAGLGDGVAEILDVCDRLARLGVYPFVAPFVPISGTPLESSSPARPEFMHAIFGPLSRMLASNGLRAVDVKAGCSRCGACSALATYERGFPP